MSLVPFPEHSKLPEDVRTALENAPVLLNIFRMMANAETCILPLTALGGSILGRQQLDARLRELAILHLVVIEGGRYEWIQHVPIALAVGVTQEQVDALENGRTDAACWSAIDRLVLRFTEEVVNQVKADESTVRSLMQQLSPREVVELILAIGFYMMMSRLTETTRTDLDDPSGTKVIAAIQR